MNADRHRVCHGRCSLKNLGGSESRIAGAFSSAFICVYLRPSLFLRPLTAVSEVTECSIQPQLEARLVCDFEVMCKKPCGAGGAGDSPAPPQLKGRSKSQTVQSSLRWRPGWYGTSSQAIY